MVRRRAASPAEPKVLILRQMAHFQAHRLDFRHFHIRIVGFDDDTTQVTTTIILAVGAGHVDDVGDAGIAAPHLAAVDDQLVAVFHDPGCDFARVRSDTRLCRRRAGDLLALEQVRQEQFFLLWCRFREDTRDGAFVAHNADGEEGWQLLVDEAVIQHRHTGPAIGLG